MFLVAVALLIVSVGVWAVSLSSDSLLAGQFTNNAFRSCVDSDETNNFKSFTDASSSLFTAGAAKVTFKDKSETKLVDFCITETTLNEYGCFGTVPGSVAVRCENGCADGACLIAPPTAKPDLVVSNIYTPNVIDILVGDTLNYSFAFENMGDNNANAIGFVRNSCRVETPSGHVSYKDGAASINLGQGERSAFTCAIQFNESGQHILTFYTDIENTISEKNELNNNASIGVSVSGGANLRALVVDKVINDSGNISVQYRVAGADTTRVTVVRIVNFSSTSSEFTYCTYPDSAFSCVPDLPTSPFKVCIVNNTVCRYPAYQAGARYFVNVSSDEGGRGLYNVSEFFPVQSSSGGSGSGGGSGAVRGIDFGVYAVYAKPASGNRATGNATIRNWGVMAFSGKVNASCSMRSPSGTSVSYVVGNTLSLGAGEAKDISCGTFVFTKAGTYNYTFTIDSSKTIAEANEKNNVNSTAFVFTP